MITLTPVENDLRAYLIKAAGANDPKDRIRPYPRVAEATDPEYDPHDESHGWLKQRLFHISSYEAEHGRPMLSALVVNRYDYRPENDLYDLARRLGRLKDGDDAVRWWNTELDEISRYWTTHSDDPLQDAQFNAIMTELAHIKRMLRTLMHA